MLVIFDHPKALWICQHTIWHATVPVNLLFNLYHNIAPIHSGFEGWDSRRETDHLSRAFLVSHNTSSLLLL